MPKMSLNTSNSPTFFPLVLDKESKEQKLKDFMEIFNETYSDDIKNIIEKSQYNDLLPAILSNSPYLSRLLYRNKTFAIKLFQDMPDSLIKEVFETLKSDFTNFSNITDLMTALRTAKTHMALISAFADLSGQWRLEKITKTLSEFAEISLNLSVNYLIKEALISGDLSHVEYDENINLSDNSGYVILAMGKLGSYELNYSSDIDLIVLYDHAIIKYSGRKTAQDFFVKLTQKLVKIISDRTQDGYVFRTDLRLRPDSGATPIALSMEGAEIYYQSAGLNWERAAMIKARPIAGDLNAGYEFLKRINGFIWRRHLDYAAIDDIHAIKKLIHEHHNHSNIRLEGHDVKLGRGGIREIEFFAQIHQLIAGGREPSLRVAPTCAALNALENEGKLNPDDNKILQNAYVYLRTLEHRLQMINDDQTHEIPNAHREVVRITKFMGYDQLDEFKADLLEHLNAVHFIFNNLLRDNNQTEDSNDNSLSFPTDKYHPDTIKAIQTAGFQNAEKIYDTVKNWQLGRYRACRTERARRLLKQLIPDILTTFGHHNDPDSGLIKFDDFLSKLPSGVQLFSFIKAQPWLLELLAQITGIAPFLSNQLSRQPLLLDSMINADIFAQNSSFKDLNESLKEQLSVARDFQDTLDITRKWANEGKFQVGLQILRGNTDVTKFGKTLTYIAQITLDAMFEQVKKEFAKKHGTINNSSIAILAMGKLGGYEFTTTSDVDMILIYDAEDMSEISDGEKQLSANHYYARLSQNFINSITALTGEGKLYEVDMRLRPSGTAGPLAVSLESFNDYQIGQAWTWEHMALTRGRVISGPKILTGKIEKYIKDILTQKNRNKDNLLFDVAKMRHRLAENFTTTDIWSIKHVRGGIVDVEFICQYLILNHASQNPVILEKNTLKQIAILTKIGILPKDKGEMLYQACHFLQSIQSILRLCLGTTSQDNNRPNALLLNIATKFKCKPDEIEILIREKQDFILNLYNEIIELPASKMISPS